jgi:glycosyltransferase involved in cell wall biosynthesis
LLVTLSPKISIIITSYNRKEFLIEAVKSVLMNDFPRELYEIVVSKNFTDNYIDGFLQKNDVVIINTVDINIGEQIYLAVTHSLGDIICFLDDDDRFKENKLKYVYSRFSENSDLVYYHNSADLIDDNSFPISGKIYRKIKEKVVIRGPAPDGIANYLRKRDDFTLYSLLFNLSCVSIKRSVVLSFSEYLRKIIDGTDWFVFYCSLLSSGTMEFDTEILTEYRFHDSTSNVLNRQISLKEFSEISINKFDKEGHFPLVIAKFCNGTGAETILRAKIIEEKILLRILGKSNKKVSLREYFEYLQVLRYLSHPSFKNIFVRFIFIDLSLFFPSITGTLYNMYRRHSLISKLPTKTL